MSSVDDLEDDLEFPFFEIVINDISYSVNIFNNEAIKYES
jgi:hypothetical protein